MDLWGRRVGRHHDGPCMHRPSRGHSHAATPRWRRTDYARDVRNQGTVRRMGAVAAAALLAVSGCSNDAGSGDQQTKNRHTLETAGWLRHDISVSREIWTTSTKWMVDGKPSVHMSGVSAATGKGKRLRGAIGSLELSEDSDSSGYYVQPGKTYTVRTPVKIVQCPDAGGPGVFGEMFFYDVVGHLLKETNGDSLNKPCRPGTTTLTVSGTAPEGVTYLQPIVVMATAAPGDTMEFYAGTATLLIR